MISEVMLAVTLVLLFGTVSTLLLYYRRIRMLNQEYNQAKGLVNNIIVSVDRQFSRQKDRVLFFTQKIEDILLDNKKVTKQVEDYEGRLSDLTKIIAAVPHIEDKFLEQLNEMHSEVVDIKETHDRVMKKLYKDGYLERDTHKMPYVYRLKEEMQKILKKREASAS